MSAPEMDRAIRQVLRPVRLTRPGVVRDVDLHDPLPFISGTDADGRRIGHAYLLIRYVTEPLGALLLPVPEDGLSAAAIAEAVDGAPFGGRLRQRLATAGLDGTGPLPDGGAAPLVVPPYLAERRAVLADAPHLTVVLCTRERPGALARCLDSLLAQQYPHFRILVVDNAPETAATSEVVLGAARRAATMGRITVDYVVERTPGLSHARNRAVEAAPGETLCWIDDDEEADPHWLAEIARALAAHPDADVISGVIVPAELETEAQLWFEQFGGHSKGRGFDPFVFGPSTAHVQSPLYPLPPFGTGANMVFRPGVIERIGGWDVALGAGTPAQGSEDTLAFTQVLLGGGTIVYAPSVLVRHYHRRDLDGLRRQMIGYGTGLTAAYTALIMAAPRLLLPLLRLVPTALRDLTAPDSLRVSGLKADFPRELLGANRRGMLAGPRAYLRGLRAEKHRRLGADGR